MQTFLSSTPYSERVRPLLGVQFLGVFNDNAFKMLAILAVIGSGVDPFKDAAFMFTITIFYVAPFVLLTAPAGKLSDVFQKRYVLILTKIWELGVMVLGSFCLGNASSWGMLPLLAVMFLMTSQTSFFSPAFNGILPETFSERELSKANGDIGMASFIAAITGIGAAPLLKHLSGMISRTLTESGIQAPDAFFFSGLWLCLFSLLGIVSAFKVIPTAEYEQEFAGEKRSASLMQSLVLGWRALTERKSILLAALGDAFFIGIGVAVQTLLVMFAKYGLKEYGGDVEIAALQLSPAIGMGLGCYLCGRLSGNKIELGLVPYGALGLAVFLPLAGYCPGEALRIHGVLLHPLALLWLCLAGICSGFFVIPLRTFLQQALKPAVRGAALACSNAICFTVVLLSAAGAFLLQIGSMKLPEGTPEYVVEIAGHIPSFTPSHLFLFIALLTIGVTVFAMFLLPDLALRFGVVALTHSLYKIRIVGAENIPESGPVLLVANHVSFIDGFLITACTSRKIRFLMHEDFYRHPLIHPFVKLTGFIEVPAQDRLKSMQEMFGIVQEALRRGEAVCVFPEGKITRNGLIDDFKAGYAMMLPPDRKVPIVPVYLGMIWGSIFSYYYGRLKFRLPREFPYPALVSFGKPILRENVSAFELRQAVSELGADAEQTPRKEERTLHYQLAKHASRHPFRVMVQDYDGKSLTAFQLLVASIVLSREIRKMVPDSVKYVGVMLPNTVASSLSVTAVLMADKVPSPLNFTVSAETLDCSIRKAGITLILTSRKFLQKIHREPVPQMVFLEDVAARIPKKNKLFWAVLTAILPHQELMNLVSPVTHRNVFGTAVLLFSSGSTGEPKGVLLSHRNINGDIYSFMRVMGWTRRDKILGNLPLFHSFGFTTGYWMPLAIACKVVYVVSPLDAATVGNAIEKYGLTIFLATPTFMQAYMKRCRAEQFKSVRLAIVGAEKLRRDIAERFAGVTDNRIALVEGYGCTELSPIVSINIGSSILELGKVIGKAGSIGAPMPGICVKIVDPVTGVELPPDTDGLMLVKGPNVMQGYLEDPAQTARVIENGWYDTGDIARMDIDGYITISGRLSRFSKIAGEMVPHEMLECVLNELAGTEDRIFAVTGIPDPGKGEALVVLHTAAMKMTPEEMNAMLRERSIPNLWIPRPQNYWLVDRIPVLASGKLDMMELNAIMPELIRKQKKMS